MTHKRPCLPRFLNSHPAHLATAAELEADGLKPGTREPVALFEYERGDCSGLCGLWERAAAVPKEKAS